MDDFVYAFQWNGDLHVGVPLPDERSELNIHAPKGLDVEIGETIVENGRAVIPVVFHNKSGKSAHHEIKFEFV